jgi:hypothetical protein
MCNSVAQPITPRRLMPQEEYDLKVIITFKSNIFLPKIAKKQPKWQKKTEKG